MWISSARGDVMGGVRGQRKGGPPGQQEATDTAGGGQQQAFERQLPDQTQASRAQGRSQGHFPGTHG